MAWRDFRGRGAALVVTVVFGAVWWGAVLRLVLVPERTGVVEGAVAAGGWGLSLLPVHVVSAAAAGVDSRRRRRGPGRTPGAVLRRCGVAGAVTSAVTRALRRRRSGGGSGPS
ncbi:hypothetical protein J7E96_29830 [Streptomyces sp. ISL-96]|uniref:hypothetical protein n=1 Tax=Streptomyces sp. ISL-96 TaxID=2819191 RepID=UPI001BE70932|nr:hypothetical protein [Streptomyces sp. ISL-96]MBT2492636.1 hypothetical protein [Streptomyces sp. ISL-96]